MHIPFNLFCNAGLGISHSSFAFEKLHTSRCLNSSQTQSYVNAVNGNTVISDHIFKIVDDQFTLPLGMIWNSLDNTWRFTNVPKIIPVTPSFFTLTEGDGRILKYERSKKTPNGTYVCSELTDQGNSIITVKQDGSFERTFANSDIIELFDAKGNLKSKRLPTGKPMSFDYDDKNDLNVITLPSGRKVQIEQIHNEKTVRLIQPDGNTTILVRYTINSDGLKTAIPQPNDEPDYITSYLFKKDKQRATLKIESADNTAALFEFTPQGKIRNLVEGCNDHDVNRTWTFEFNEKQSKLNVKDQEANQYEVIFDNKKLSLSGFKLPTDNVFKKFKCTSPAQVDQIFDPDNPAQNFIYDQETGLVITFEDRLRNVTRNFYIGDIQSPYFGLKTASCSNYIENQKNDYTFYIYNGKRQCCFEVSPEGRVIKYEYDSNGHPQFIKKVTSKFYSVSLLSVTNEPKVQLDKLSEWWRNLNSDDLSQLQITELCQDQYGRQNKEIKYVGVDESGHGILTQENITIHQELNAIGHAEKISVALTQDRNIETIKEVDLLDRLRRVEEGAQKDSQNKRYAITHYLDNKTLIKYSDGLQKLYICDASGLKKYEQRTDGHAPRSTGYLRFKNGTLKKIINEDGQPEYQFYQGTRLKYKITADGVLSAFEYDARGNLTCEHTYEKRLQNHDQLTLADLKIYTSAHIPVISQYHLYDDENHLRFEVTVKNVTDKQGKSKRQAHVIEHEYKVNDKIATREFVNAYEAVNKISYSQIDAFCTEQCMSMAPMRFTKYFYDLDHNIIGEQTLVDEKNNLGYLKRYERDAAGNIYHEIIYLDKLSMQTKLDATSLEVLPILDTWHLRDNAGRIIATLDTDNHLSAFTYFANGKIRKEIEFSDAAVIDRKKLALTTLYKLIKIPKENPKKDKVVEHFLDDLGRENKIVNYLLKLQIDIAYDEQDHEVSRTMTDLVTKEQRCLQKTYNLFGEVLCEADPRISAVHGDNKNHWVLKDHHRTTGLELRSIDATDGKQQYITCYFYDTARRPVISISPGGIVTTFTYDQPYILKPTLIRRYFNRLDNVTLKAWQNDLKRSGFVNDAL